MEKINTTDQYIKEKITTESIDGENDNVLIILKLFCSSISGDVI